MPYKADKRWMIGRPVITVQGMVCCMMYFSMCHFDLHTGSFFCSEGFIMAE